MLNLLSELSGGSRRPNLQSAIQRGVVRQWANRLLKLCYVRPFFEFSKAGVSVVWKANPELKAPTREYIEWLRLVLDAFDRGWLLRARSCRHPCGRWFVAEDLREVYCSDRCKNRAYNRSGGGKETRRKYMKTWMRKHRRNLKQQEERDKERLRQEKDGKK
jgi:hypothetical protein